MSTGVFEVVVVAMVLAIGTRAQETPPPSPAPVVERGQARSVFSGTLHGADGKPLRAGDEVEVRVEVYAPGFNIGGFRSVAVGEGAAFEVEGSSIFGWHDVGTPAAPVAWLHVRRTRNGRLERALVAARADLGWVQLEAEMRLAAGRVVDELGAPVMRHAFRVGVAPATALPPTGSNGAGAAAVRAPVMSARLQPRLTYGAGTFELWGFRAPGEFLLSPSYIYHGPSGRPQPLAVGATDVELVLPATGHLQVKLKNPVEFPRTRAVWAVLRDLDRDSIQRRWLASGSSTNLRVLTGRYRVTCELNGREVADLGEQLVKHNATTEVAVDLRASARVLLIEVLDDKRRPVPAARAGVVGSPDQPFSRQRVQVGKAWQNVIPLPVGRRRVDVELPYYLAPDGSPRLGVGGMTFVVRGVTGNCVLVLQSPTAPRDAWSLVVERPR